MPRVPFDQLPDSARVWVFASDRELDTGSEKKVLEVVDEFLNDWAAHGAPLTSGRELSDHRFITIAVDPSTSQASGCSIDGLYRVFRSLQDDLGVSFLTGGMVFYRVDGEGGAVRGVQRDDFTALSGRGEITPQTAVFDTTVASAGEWRERFEAPAARTWHRELLLTN
jgi:hypothetical protein